MKGKKEATLCLFVRNVMLHLEKIKTRKSAKIIRIMKTSEVLSVVISNESFLLK